MSTGEIQTSKEAALREIDEEAALRMIAEGTASATGEDFFRALTKNLAQALGTACGWVTEYLPDEEKLVALAFWMDEDWIEGYWTPLIGPCEVVVTEKRLVHFPENVVQLFPDDPDVKEMGAVSYLGVPLLGTDESVMGHLAVMDFKPMPEQQQILSIFKIFAARATAELRRIRAERDVFEREEKLGRLVASAMDAIIELDGRLEITQVNPAAEKVFGCAGAATLGQPFVTFLTEESEAKFRGLIVDLDKQAEGQRSLWIPGGLTARSMCKDEFAAEATIARTDAHGAPFYTVILRNVNDRLAAEHKIQTLSQEAEYLKEELKQLQNFGTILGESAAIRRVLEEIGEVAGTDATVLVFGETGTGKELVARAIHDASGRNDQPLVKVNCAAIPSALMESEFFGHEKGAFTGATERRVGRFALADGGTIFLDEVGELSLELQSKLLRVLQEGEFEPVGSSETRKVNVRVIAATNRDLEDAVSAGEFRQDLYYRLNVFPIEVPPLRQRGDDIVLLAEAFAERFARKMARRLDPFTEDCVARLKAYAWPGNVRELENIIERAVITARDGRLNLQRALPDVEGNGSGQASNGGADTENRSIRTAAELQAIERENIMRALESVGWRVAGENGAAKLLGMNPSTLSSRMKALGIERPKGS